MQALVTLDDLRSISKAAQAMGVTQPAMSQLVAELEALLEVQLYLRHSRGVVPTTSAIELLPVARRILTATEEAATRIAFQQAQDGGLVRIAATVAGSGALLHTVLPQFSTDYPNVKVTIDRVVGQALDQAFSLDEFDLICCREREVVPTGWQFIECLPDALVTVAGRAHPLSSRTNLDIEELRDATWLSNQPVTIARHGFDKLLANRGWTDTKQVPIMSRIPLLTYRMLEAGHTLCLVPRSAMIPWLSTGALVELPVNMNMPLPAVGYYRKVNHAGSATRALARRLRSVSGDTPDQRGLLP
ncbi:LysR family transcriptional regulator [Roseinatronobacter sp.]|uniref:LysR family transcriptional regulator n=1 Tax=Roseinatronobacter sp. TaxID=1945755 RepID=UPI003F728172